MNEFYCCLHPFYHGLFLWVDFVAVRSVNLTRTNLFDSYTTWTQGIFLKWKEFLICQFPGGNFCVHQTKTMPCRNKLRMYKATLNLCKLGWFWQRQSPNKCSFLWKYISIFHCAYHALIQLITLVRFEPW